MGGLGTCIFSSTALLGYKKTHSTWK